jgi:DUF2905 family protein
MMGRTLILIGIVIVIIGLFFTFAPRIPFLGKLPGDIFYKRDKFVIYFPITTSIIISVVLSLILYLINRR